MARDLRLCSRHRRGLNHYSLGAPPLALIHPVALLLALFWPMQIAQTLGWFGLTFH